MGIIAFEEFEKIYLDNLRKISQFWSRTMQEEMSLHCASWHPDVFNFSIYLDYSSKRYYKAYSDLAKRNNIRSICDIGGLWGVFPITMKQIGYKVTMTESLKYYSDSFDPLFDYIRSQQVQVINYDPFEDSFPVNEIFDAITIMAILEHYPHSLKTFFGNTMRMLKKNGIVFLECPNILYWQKRWGMLTGKSPLPPIETVYNSKIPFIGHHHEMTISELEKIAKFNKLEVQNQYFFNYSIGRKRLPLKYYIRRSRWILIIQAIATYLWPNTSECIAISCIKTH
jgi:2-polyprenyl-3-methyl-5-hydroxy-6-metoxy-1,4-benzoquinol methylase